MAGASGLCHGMEQILESGWDIDPIASVLVELDTFLFVCRLRHAQVKT
jgi:hypothetical protein